MTRDDQPDDPARGLIGLRHIFGGLAELFAKGSQPDFARRIGIVTEPADRAVKSPITFHLVLEIFVLRVGKKSPRWSGGLLITLLRQRPVRLKTNRAAIGSIAPELPPIIF